MKIVVAILNSTCDVKCLIFKPYQSYFTLQVRNLITGTDKSWIK